jgi:hypothetical protein
VADVQCRKIGLPFFAVEFNILRHQLRKHHYAHVGVIFVEVRQPTERLNHRSFRVCIADVFHFDDHLVVEEVEICTLRLAVVSDRDFLSSESRKPRFECKKEQVLKIVF